MGSHTFFTQVFVGINHISENAPCCKSHCHVRDSESQDWSDPMGLIVDRRSKAKKSCDTKKHDRKHKYESEFRLVDSVIPPRKYQADVIVQWSSDNLSDESQDKRGDADEADLRHCEVVWRKRED